jgi:hypothetical protein
MRRRAPAASLERVRNSSHPKFHLGAGGWLAFRPPQEAPKPLKRQGWRFLDPGFLAPSPPGDRTMRTWWNW